MAFPFCPVHGAHCDGKHHHQRHQSDQQPRQRDRKFRPTMQDCSNFLVEVKRTLPQETYKEFIRTARDLKNSGCNVLEVARKMESVLVNQPRLMNLFCNFLPESERQRFFKSLPGYPRAFAFIHKVKALFANEIHKYESFVAVLQQIKDKNLQEIAEEVAEILGNHNDLVEEFNSFLPTESSHTEHLSSHQSLNPQNEGETSIAIAHRKMVSIAKSQQMQILEEGNGENPVDEHPTQDEVDDQHDKKNLEKHLTKQKSSKVVDHFGSVRFDRNEEDDQNSTDKDEDSKVDMNHEKDETGQENLSESDSDKAREILGKVLPFSSTETECKLYNKDDFNPKKAEICTPSYRFLPKNYPTKPASNRTILGASVLNDVVVSVTSGREDCSFTLMRRNQYEEILFKCEDDRYGLDMLLEMVRATIEKIEKLLEALQDSKRTNKTGIRVQKYLSFRNMRCIESIYDDHGLDIVDHLCKSPGTVLPIVLARLKQKQEEWTRSQTDLQEKWNEVFAKNYKRSLDHRDFYFKQQDAKNLNIKALLAGVKEMKKKMLKEDHGLVASFLGESLYEVPIMQFEYPDTDIHEDLYNIIVFSANEFCSSEGQFNKVLTIWTSFLEHVFGVVPRRDASSRVDLKDERQGGDVSPVVESHDMGNESSTSSYETREIRLRDGFANKSGQSHTDNRTDAAENGPDGSGSEFGDSHERVCKISDGEEKVAQADIEAEEGIQTADADDLEGSGSPHLEAKPLNVHSDKASNIQDHNSRIFYGNSSFYILFRLHQILYERIRSTKKNLLEVQKGLTAPSSSNAVDHYAEFMNALYSLIGGSIDNSQYEDKCRDTIGNQSYVLFTLDKLIKKIIKQLQAIASSDIDNQFLQLYDYETSRRRGLSYDLRYRKNASVIHDKDLFRFVCYSEPVKLFIQSIELGNREYQVTSTLIPDHEADLHNDFLKNTHDKEIGGIFLKRCRNTKKSLGDGDPSTAYGDMEGVHILNGLQCNLKMPMKRFYVTDTEDVLFRERKKRKRSDDEHISESNIDAARSKGRKSQLSLESAADPGH